MVVLNRRAFLRRSVMATGAVAATPSISMHSKLCDEKAPPTITGTLGRTGITLPVVSVAVERSDAAIVRAALKSGVVHFDTAHAYVNGKNEVMLGNVLKDCPRSSVVVSTKVWGSESKESFLADLDVSLKRLQMESVDVLYLHGRENRDNVESPVCFPVN
jgi:uncharacterized protein